MSVPGRTVVVLGVRCWRRRRRIPFPVELDNEGQDGKELDLVVRVGDQMLGQLPAFGRPLQPMEHVLRLCNLLRRKPGRVQPLNQLYVKPKLERCAQQPPTGCKWNFVLTASTSARDVGSGWGSMLGSP